MPSEAMTDHSAKLGGYDVRETATGEWEVFDRSSGKTIQLSGIPLSHLTRDEALGAIHLLKSGGVRPDAQK